MIAGIAGFLIVSGLYFWALELLRFTRAAYRLVRSALSPEEGDGIEVEVARGTLESTISAITPKYQKV